VSKARTPIVLAKDTYFIRTVLEMLNDAEGLFTTDADKEEFLQTIKKRGKISYHHGWDTMCRAVEAKKRGADPRFWRVVEFVTGELREFILSIKGRSSWLKRCSPTEAPYRFTSLTNFRGIGHPPRIA
jgi:hypothetical protein